MKNNWFIIITTAMALFSQSAGALSSPQFFELLVSSKELSRFLSQKNFKDDEAQEIKISVNDSLAALQLAHKKNAKEAEAVLNKLNLSSRDQFFKKELIKSFGKNSELFKREEFLADLNLLFYIATLSDPSLLLINHECQNERLAQSGFTFGLIHLKASTAKLISENLSTKKILSKMNKLGYGTDKKFPSNFMAPYEEKWLALFLTLAEKGNSDQKEFAEIVKKISTNKGKAQLLNPQNPHKFWKIMSDDMSSTELSIWIKILEETEGLRVKRNLSVEEAFNRTLKDKAKGNDFLLKHFEMLKSKRCFFR